MTETLHRTRKFFAIQCIPLLGAAVALVLIVSGCDKRTGDSTTCAAAVDCHDGYECVDDSCNLCPAAVVLGCEGGTVTHESYGKECVRTVCACDDGDVYDIEHDRCVFGPIMEVTCDVYLGLMCLAQFPPTEISDTSSFAVLPHNTGDSPLHILSVALQDNVPGVFSVAKTDPLVISAQEFGAIDLEFSPTVAGVFTATLIIQTDSIYNPTVTIPLEGATPDAPCSVATDCPHYFDCTTGMCDPCFTSTPPACFSGNIHGVSHGHDCIQPVCECPVGTVYISGDCVAVSACTNGTCGANQTCTSGLCCSFPSCLCGDEPDYCVAQ